MFEAAEVGSALDKEAYEAELPQLRVDLINAQYDLRSADFPVLILITGDDRPACNEVVQVLHEWMDARYLPVFAFSEPSEEEQERPRFWRYWRQIPGKGEARIFFGAWASNTIAERIRKEIDELEFERRIEHIERFEQALVDDGALVLKFWLHLPKKEHKKRLKKAEKKPEKGWRLDERDWQIYEIFDEALPHVERLLQRTSTGPAPWQVVETTDHRWRNWTVAKTVLAALTNRLAAAEAPPVPPARALSAAPVPAMLDTVDLTASLPRDEYRAKLEKLQGRLRGLDERAREKGVASVLVFEGWDAAGKGGVIRRITAAMDARDYRVVPIAAPTPEEKAHHYLWRFWRHLPRAGRMLIFDRSWYGRVLVERVEGLAREDDWRRAYGEIVDFESQIAERGIPLLKFWLHLDPDEQLRRFQQREGTPYKKYKIGQEDYRNREKWPAYVAAVNEMVARTSSDAAPWQMVAANDKPWARVQVLDAVCDALERAVGKG